GEPPLRLVGQPALERRAHVRRDVAGGADWAGADRSDELVGGMPDEGAAPVQRLPQRDAQRELVALRVGALALELLGRHRVGRAHAGARARELVAERGVDRAATGLERLAREPEVDDLDP